MEIKGFLPKLLIENINKIGSKGIFHFYGTTIFVDLSGFTRISEFFAQFGKEGSETLTKVLNDFFEKFYHLLKKYDGDILRFAGDALTCFFKDDFDKKRVKTFSHELIKMMEDFENYKTTFGNTTLKLKGGCAKGNIDLIILGEEVLDYTFSGFGIAKAIEAEKRANPLEIVEYVEDQREIFKENLIEDKEKIDINKFIDPYLKDIIKKGEVELLNGHRRVVILFLKVGKSYSYNKDIINFIEEIISTVKDYGGFLNKIDFSDKGNVLMVLFGAPLFKGEEVERAIEFSLNLKKRSEEKKISLKMGLNYEVVYCGIVGSRERFEYTVMGDGVNLSARLMEISAENEITTSRRLEEKAPPFYIFDKLAPVKVKGKEKPIEISVLRGKKGEIIEAKALVGRKGEIEKLSQLFLEFKENKPFISIILGPPGIGKSHFLNYFFKLQNLRVENLFYTRCSSITSSIPLYPLRDLLIKSIEKFYEKITKAEILKIIEKEAPETKEFISILFEFLGIEEKRDLKIPPEVYKNLLNKFILTILNSFLKLEKLYFFIDNCHFLDNDTIEFIKFSLKLLEKRGLYIFLAGREDKFGEEKMFDFYGELKPLEEDQIREFVLNFLKVKEVPLKLLKNLNQFTGGNPQFIQEVLKIMLKKGYLERSIDFPEILILNEAIPLEIPETLEGIALKELDLLSLEEKKVLQIFSVIGENIPLELVYKLGIKREIVEKIYREGIFLGFNPEKNRYFFIKQTYRDAIYESLEFSFKRSLHNKIGKILERFYREDVTLLAYHFYNGKNKKAVDYLDILYNSLKRSFSLQESYKILKNLIEIAKIHKKNYKNYLIEISYTSLLMGMIKEAEKIIRENEEILKGKYKSKALNLLGEILRLQGIFHESEKKLKESIKFSKEKIDKFKSYFALARFYSFLGNYKEAKKYYKKTFKFREFENLPEFHSSKAYFYYILYETKKIKGAIKIFEKEANWFKEKNYLAEYLIFLNNLSNFYVYEGKYKKAIKNYELCLEKIFDYCFLKPDVIINILLNTSLLNIYLGNFQKAMDDILKAISFSKKFNSILLSKAFSYLSFLNLYLGNFKEAINNLTYAINEAKSFNFPYDEFLQFGMDISYEMGSVDFFKEYLKEYKEIVEKENLLFLRNTLLNYESELSILEKREKEYIEKQKLNLRISLKEKNYIDAFRSMRFLFISTGNISYLKKMEKLFKNFEHFIYKIEFLIFNYRTKRVKRNRSNLLNLLSKCPDNTLKMKGYLALGDYEKAVEIFKNLKEKVPTHCLEDFSKFLEIK